MNQVAEASAAELAAQPFEMPLLKEGEFNAGLIMENATPSYWLIGLPGDKDDGNHADATQWATEQGGELPTRREQALLFANAKEQFKDDWYWSIESHASYEGCAWVQDFHYGGQRWYSKSGHDIRARAVRRVPI